jgi:hypothetical protein
MPINKYTIVGFVMSGHIISAWRKKQEKDTQVISYGVCFVGGGLVVGQCPVHLFTFICFY